MVLAAALLVVVRDHRALSRYAYTLGLAGIVLVMIPAVLPAQHLRDQRRQAVDQDRRLLASSPVSSPSSRCSSFFAYYLVRKREVLSLASQRFLGIDFPRGRDLGPVVAVWLLSLMVLVFEKDLGTSLLYFGMFVVTLYIATERVSWLIIGLLLFFGGALPGVLARRDASAARSPTSTQRAEIWLDPFADAVRRRLPAGPVAARPGHRRPVRRRARAPASPTEIPEVHNDFIFAGMGEEIGLFGLSALLVLYLLIVERGLRAGARPCATRSASWSPAASRSRWACRCS